MAIVQSTEVDFNLHTLGWKGFQDLCLTITSEILGQSTKSFQSTNDGGRDGFFQGKWNNSLGEGVDGTVTIQCKHTSKLDHSLTLSLLKEEFLKAALLMKDGLADNYVLFTNLTVSGDLDNQIRQEFLKLGVKSFHLYNKAWITSKIRESSKLRMLVPRVYGLGDLSQILDERSCLQAKEILESISDDLSKFVITEAHQKSVHALLQHGFVMLLGEPASGKSTIASTLSLCAIDEWKCSTVKISNPSDFHRHWNPNEPNRFFWVDDVFGSTQYQRSDVDDWNKTFISMNAAIKKGAKIIFTSRDYIYKAAYLDLKISAFPLLKDSQVVIEVQKLSALEKKKILYNHIKLGGQNIEFRMKVKPYLDTISDSNYFLPEIARRLGNPFFTKNLPIDEANLKKFIDSPKDFLISTLQNLSKECKAALSIVFMNQGVLSSPIRFSHDDKAALQMLGVSEAHVRENLEYMKDSLVKFLYHEGERFWTFKHPSIADGLSYIIGSNSELLEIYLRGTKIDLLIREVSCGDIGTQGIKVIVPSSYFVFFIEKLADLKNPNDLNSFISNRCNKQFIELYIKKNPDYIEKLQIHTYLHACTGAFVIAKLHELRILPEHMRAAFVEEVVEVSLEMPDSDFLEIDRIRNVFKKEELENFKSLLKEKLFNTDEDVMEIWASGWTSANDPDEFFQPLLATLDIFQTEFAEDEDISHALKLMSKKVTEKINDINDEYSNRDYDGDYFRENDGIGSTRNSNVSIFDDVDE